MKYIGSRKTPLIAISVLTFAVLGAFGFGLYLNKDINNTDVKSSAASNPNADLNGDNIVNIQDLSILITRWTTADAVADINNDNIVNIQDLSILISSWGAVSTTPPTSSGCPAYPAFPTASCTGAPAGTNFTVTNGDLTISSANSVVDAKRITGNLIINANNVVVKNSEVYGSVLNYGKNLQVETTTIGPLSGCNSQQAIAWSDYAAKRIKIRNFGDGVRVSGDNILVEDSLITLCSQPGDHSDGVQGYGGGTNVIIRHNTIDQRQATEVTSPVFFADNSKSATVENNLLAGGGYSLRIHDDANPDTGPWIVRGNRIVQNSYVYGPTTNTNTDCGAGTMAWADNRLVTIDSNYNVLTTGALVNCN